MRGQFYLPENVVDLGCLTQPQQEVGGAVIATFAPATNKESDFIIMTVICSLIKRDIGMDMSPQKFFDKIFYVNKNLKEATKVKPAIQYHSHPGFWRDGNDEIGTSTQFSYDGLHPNSPNGRKLYAKSLKALIHHRVRDVNLGRECRQYAAF